MKILKLNNQNQDLVIKVAKQVLNSSGLVIFPTETCYGIGAIINDTLAIDRLFKFMGDKRGNKPVSILVSDIEMAKKFVNMSDLALKLYEKYTPGPITIVSESNGAVDERLEAGTKTLGVRIPDYQFVIKLAKSVGNAITATSANISGGVPPYNLDEFIKNNPKESIDLVDLFIDAGNLPLNEASAVVGTIDNNLTIYRQGAIDINIDN